MQSRMTHTNGSPEFPGAVQVVKHLRGYRKVRYRGLEKNAAQAFTLFDLSYFYKVRRVSLTHVRVDLSGGWDGAEKSLNSDTDRHEPAAKKVEVGR